MSAVQSISEHLKSLPGFSSTTPRTVTCQTEGLEVEAEVLAVDSLSCSLHELRLGAAALRSAPFGSLQSWGQNLCQKVTYLLEQLVPVELDAQSESILIRSKQPSSQATGRVFYEVLLQNPGYLQIRRFLAVPQQPRQQVPMHMTLEVLDRLVHDIAAALP